jgi:hypothetical protein
LDERSQARVFATVGLVVAGLCLALMVAYYVRTRRSFVADWSGRGLLGSQESVAPVDAPSSDEDVEAPQSEG